MKKVENLLFISVFALAFTFLFYKTSVGFNLSIFSWCVLLYFMVKKPFIGFDKLSTIVGIGTLACSLFVLYHNSLLAIVVNVISLFLIAATVSFQFSKSLHLSFYNGIANLLASQFNFFTQARSIFNTKPLVRKWVYIFKVLFFPLIIIFVFIVIYQSANQVFAQHLLNAEKKLANFFSHFALDFDVSLFLIFILGVLISNYLILSSEIHSFRGMNTQSKDNIERQRKKTALKFKNRDLILEYKSIVFLLFVLNLLIAYINIIDVRWVWIGFVWNGETLRQFVHEGTYLLILSILISIAIVLYSFRGNLNFYKNNQLLKILTYIWLAQNMVLTLSVGMRNFRYIEHFALAYKRIGVIIFLLLTIYGIITVILKIKNKKSSFYLFRTNSLALYIMLIIIAFFDWDTIIARYNFRNYQKSYVHFNYLSSLSDKTLPILDISEEKLGVIEKKQAQMFKDANYDMSKEEYIKKMKDRKQRFLKRWESHTKPLSKNFLSICIK